MEQKIYLQEKERSIVPFLNALAAIMVTASLGLFFAQTLFFSVKTASRSMEPSVPADSVIFVNRMSYSFRKPERFHVVAFRRNDYSKDVLVRRIVGLPGETIRIYRGEVTVNGEKIDISPYISEITSDGIASDGIRLGEGEYFLLGDSPANSEDSRSSTIGVVKEEQLFGRAWVLFQTITKVQLIR